MDVENSGRQSVEALKEDIQRLKKERGAVIMAHYYQQPEVQDIADFIGDSLALAQQATKLPQKVIVLCGVHFMAETAAILCPEKTVIIPDPTAGCSLADSCPADRLRLLSRIIPDIRSYRMSTPRQPLRLSVMFWSPVRMHARL